MTKVCWREFLRGLKQSTEIPAMADFFGVSASVVSLMGYEISATGGRNKQTQ